MKSLIIILTAVLPLFCMTAVAQEKAPAKAPKASKAKSVDFSPFEIKEYQKDGLTLPYRILWPENMQKGDGKKYPLFLFLHGMGMRGTDNKAQLNRGAELFLKPENRKQYPCIALYPQAPKTGAFVEIVDRANGDKVIESGFAQVAKSQADKSSLTVRLSPYGNMVMDVVNQLIASGVVDTDRIYIAGSSMGGFSTYQFITQYPNFFAAAAPMAGAADVSKMSAWAGKVPIWIVHGADDPTVPVVGDRTVVAKLKEMGVTNFKYTEYPNTGHPSWDKAFAEPDYMKWFFSHSKTTNKQ